MRKSVLLIAVVLFWALPAFSKSLYIEIVVEERMLYVFEKDESGNRNFIEKYQICSFKPGLPEYPLGLGYVRSVEFDPYWYPVPTTVEYMNKKAGREILKKGEAVPPGDPRNAMGKFKMNLSHSTPNKGAIFRIHGTNMPSSIGTRQSGGCTRMRNEEGIGLAKKVKAALESGQRVEVNILISKATS